MAELAVEVKNISKQFGRTLALDQVSLEVPAGELFALLGPNGAGKTTLVHILCTIHLPDAGQAKIAGFDVVNQAVMARQSLGVVFQEPSLDSRLTVFENLDFHGRIYAVPTALRKQRIPEVLELVELTKWRDALVRNLSGGMKRRLEIARALMHDPALLILDEPTVGLDAQTRSRIWEYIYALQKERGMTVLVTTHYIDEVEGCDRVCIIDKGKIQALDTPEALRATYGQEVLWVEPKDALARAAILGKYPQALEHQGKLGVRNLSEGQVAAFFAEFGTRIRSSNLQTASLEDVFLALTGRAIRDQAAGGKDAMLEFGKRGGEHTQ
ncbi:ABC transporter ATP-binding protein [Meiothermus hypogaeus]|uniref:Multidrug ABC transporter ATP-binding protein n=2 Tax=Meiothermus hypogaeus TaxID=884155 RepID=A0A511R2P4_9DEIN|nr:ABC transporter ATP-binding protein [Meiothermus hypogaeus]RIH76084.1 Daunorubicin/doxorubicin resistance ATP-binding protein DrrA [Meiothermus hypogaeus]GEM83888.1 multidrug ABC transporter ATP-binding protein [Meiothermus hypogaeus NBRC 106114]GIW36436.1 MAG: multidrug ABC transporter ATP-binding protein [Meiothermus sp.]